MKEELHIFLSCVMFYTRIPCPKNIDYKPEDINKTTRYFTLIGWVVGGVSFAVYCLGVLLFDATVAVVLSIIAGVLITGAFHEDGLADVFDGFGGGWTPVKTLAIMKDSRIGAFGAIALVLLFMLKYAGLSSLLAKTDQFLTLALLFVSYHALARLTAINIVFTSQYSRQDATSKVKPIAKSYGLTEVMGAYAFGISPLIALAWINNKYLWVLLPLFLLYFFSKRYFEKKIGGYTGDCLGAVEQLAECTIILTYLAVWKFM